MPLKSVRCPRACLLLSGGPVFGGAVSHITQQGSRGCSCCAWSVGVLIAIDLSRTGQDRKTDYGLDCRRSGDLRLRALQRSAAAAAAAGAAPDGFCTYPTHISMYLELRAACHPLCVALGAHAAQRTSPDGRGCARALVSVASYHSTLRFFVPLFSGPQVN